MDFMAPDNRNLENNRQFGLFIGPLSDRKVVTGELNLFPRESPACPPMSTHPGNSPTAIHDVKEKFRLPDLLI